MEFITFRIFTLLSSTTSNIHSENSFLELVMMFDANCRHWE